MILSWHSMRWVQSMAEHDEQVAVVQWFDMQYPALSGRLFAVANGGARHIRVAVKLKAEGVRKGVPDMLLLEPRNGFHGLAIELKAKGGRLTKEQADWLQWLSERDYFAVVCVGAEAAIDTIKGYLDASR